MRSLQPVLQRTQGLSRLLRQATRLTHLNHTCISTRSGHTFSTSSHNTYTQYEDEYETDHLTSDKYELDTGNNENLHLMNRTVVSMNDTSAEEFLATCNLGLPVNLAADVSQPNTSMDMYNLLYNDITKQEDYDSMCYAVLDDLVTLRVGQEYLTITNPASLDVIKEYELVSSYDVNMDSVCTDSAYTSPAIELASEIRNGNPLPFTKVSVKNKKYYQYVLYPALRLLDIARVPLHPELYGYKHPSKKALKFQSNSTLVSIYQLIFDIMGASPVGIPHQYISILLAEMARDNITITESMGKSMLHAFSNTNDAGLLIAYTELCMGKYNTTSSKLVELTIAKDQLHTAKQVYNTNTQAMMDIFNACNDPSIRNIIPLLWQHMNQNQIVIDNTVLNSMMLALVKTNSIQNIPSLLKAAIQDDITLTIHELSNLLRVISKNLPSIVSTIQATVPPKLQQSVGTPDVVNLQEYKVYPTCSILMNSTDSSKTVYTTTPAQIHTLVTFTKLVCGLYQYIEAKNIHLDSEFVSKMIQLYIQLGLHTEAINLYKHSMASAFPSLYTQDTNTVEHQFVSSILEPFEAATTHIYSPQFPNKKTIRGLLAGNDTNVPTSATLLHVRQVLTDIENTTSLSKQEKMQVKILYILKCRELAANPATKRKFVDEIYRTLESQTSTHNTSSYYHARGLQSTVNKYVPSSYRSLINYVDTNHSTWLDTIPTVSTSAEILAQVHKIPTSTMGIFKHTNLSVTQPDEAVLKSILQISANGCTHESITLLESSLLFLRLQHLVQSQLSQDTIVIDDAMLLKRYTEYMKKYNLRIPVDHVVSNNTAICLVNTRELVTLCTSLSFSFYFVPCISGLIQSCKDYMSMRYLLQTLSNVLGLPRKHGLQPSTSKQDDIVGTFAYHLLTSADVQITDTFTNTEQYSITKQRKYDTHPELQGYTDVLDLSSLNDTATTETDVEGTSSTTNTPLSARLGDYEQVQYPNTESEYFSIFNSNNICDTVNTGLTYTSKDALIAMLSDSSTGIPVELTKSLLKDYATSTMAHKNNMLHMDLQNNGILDFFSTEYYQNLSHLHGLAHDTVIRSLRYFLHSHLVEESILIMKELVNISIVQNASLNYTSITSIARSLPTELPLFNTSSTPYTVQNPYTETTLRDAVNVYKQYYPHITFNNTFTRFITECVQGNPHALEIVHKSALGAYRNWSVPAMTKLLSASNIQYPHYALSENTYTQLDSFEKLNKLDIVQAYGVLTSTVTPYLSSHVPENIKADVMKLFPDLQHVRIKPNTITRGVMNEYRRDAMVKMRQYLSEIYSHNIYPLTSMHIIHLLLPVLSNETSIRTLTPHMVKLIQAGLPTVALNLFESLLSREKLNNDAMSKVLSTLIYTYSTHMQNEYVLYLFKKYVHPVKLTLASDYDSLQTTVYNKKLGIDVTSQALSLFKAISTSKTPLSDALSIIQYLNMKSNHEISNDTISKALVGLVRAGKQKEAIDLFMVFAQPEYMTTITHASYEKALKGILKKRTTAAAASADATKTTTTIVNNKDSSAPKLRSAFTSKLAETEKKQHLDVDDGKTLLQVDSSMKTVAKRVQQRLVMVNTTSANVSSEDAPTILYDILRKSKSSEQDTTPPPQPPSSLTSTNVYLSENLPYFNPSSVTSLDLVKEDTIHEVYTPSPFIMAFMKIFKPKSSTSIRTGTKCHTMSAEVLTAMLRVCGEGEHCYLDLAFQIFLSFHHRPYADLLDTAHASTNYLNITPEMVKDFTNLLQKHNIHPKTTKLTDRAILPIKIQTHIQNEILTLFEAYGVSKDCVVNGHHITTEAQAAWKSQQLYDNTQVAKGVIADIKYGEPFGETQNRPFYIPAVSDNVMEITQKFLYNAWCHSESPTISHFEDIKLNTLNVKLREACVGETPVSDIDIQNCTANMLTVLESSFKENIGYKRFSDTKSSDSYYQFPTDMTWIDKITLLSTVDSALALSQDTPAKIDLTKLTRHSK